MLRFSVGRATIELTQGDITRSDTSAIANAANTMLMGGGGVDGAIHRAAGPELMEALHKLKPGLKGGTLPTGQAVITPGFALQAKYVIHCVGPIYAREGERAAELLASCYREAVRLCREHEIPSVAFPSISTGVFGYPLGEAAPLAIRALRDCLSKDPRPELCRFVLFDPTTLEAYRQAATELLEPAG